VTGLAQVYAVTDGLAIYHNDRTDGDVTKPSSLSSEVHCLIEPLRVDVHTVYIFLFHKILKEQVHAT